MQFSRKQAIPPHLSQGRSLIIYGPRRVGKTTLLQQFLSSQHGKRILSVTGDDLRVQDVFARQTVESLGNFAAGYDIVAIDEAQQIPTVGMGIKILIDHFPEKRYILTGSSSFDLAASVGEPLTGRHFTLTLLPIALSEFNIGRFELEGDLEDYLIYGSYPEVVLAASPADKERILNELTSSYLYKDVLALDKVRSPQLIRDIARLIAFQVGSEVSLNEIAVRLGTNPNLVGRYLDVLEKMFVIRKVSGYSRNLRTEISKKAKYYFLDNGVRNAVIGQFQPLSMRNDIGALWENFVFMEFLKQSSIIDRADQYYFWRTHSGQEVDIIQESGGRVIAIECKWSTDARVPRLWSETYPESRFMTINKKNFLDIFLTGE